jgi:hypothetical protein
MTAPRSSSPFRVALVVIARDEAARIARLLHSVAPWVDEMLVLDTGSVDDTAVVARACGARVEHFAWCDDFAAARNAALAAAGAGWHVVLDADEWLIDGGPALRALATQPPGFVGAVHLEDRFFDGQWRTTHIDISRVLPGAVRYRGRVHEQPEHGLQVRPLQVRIGHDGYAPEELQRKRGRNRALLQAELAERPDDAYLWYQLGKDHAVYEEHADASDCFARTLQRAAPGSPWHLDLVARALYSMKCCQRHDAAMAMAEAQMAACAESPDFFFALGDLLLDQAAREPQRGEALLPLIEAAWTRCLELGERPALHGAVAGRGSYLAAHNLAVMYESLGDAAPARRLRRDYPLPEAVAAGAR